mgnify:CR=1 FL=1
MNRTLQAVAGCCAILLAGAAFAQGESSWTDRITLDGDFRLRYESIDAEGDPTRDRARIRGRFGLEAEASDDLKFVFRFATGTGSPVSTNVTLDSGFSGKDIFVDRAYVDWTINDAFRLFAGKIRRPWFRAGDTQIVWDNDLNPEGLALLYDDGPLFGSLGAMMVEERSADDDSLLLTLQGGWRGKLGDNAGLTAGASYFAYEDTVGRTPFYDGDPAGNRVDLAGNYLADFRIVELFAEFSTRLDNWPLRLYAATVQNTAVDDEDSGFTVGVTAGDTDEPGRWEFDYAWRDTEADAVVGTFNDSNFGGGETDSRGHVIQSTYALRENVSLRGTLFFNERGMSTGVTQDYQRVIFDIQFSFE